jgi:hypothetical protein
MKTSTIALTLVGITLALSACNRPDNDRTTSIPRGIDPATTLQDPTAGRGAPPAPLERGPIPPNANAAAPGTDAKRVTEKRQSEETHARPPRPRTSSIVARRWIGRSGARATSLLRAAGQLCGRAAGASAQPGAIPGGGPATQRHGDEEREV